MALIKCPKCGKEISDKAPKCIYCGYDLSNLEQDAITEQDTVYTCPECGTQLDKDAKECPKCGCPIDLIELDESDKPDGSDELNESDESSGSDEPDDNKDSSEELSKSEEVEAELKKVEETTDSSSKRLSRKGIIAIIVVVVIAVVVIAVGVGVHSRVQTNRENEAMEAAIEEYSESLSSITTDILISAADAESAGNLIKSVWNNCIYEKSSTETDPYTRKLNGKGSFYDDFNDALQNLFSDSDFVQSILTLQISQSSITSQVKEMQNPPDEFSSAYDALMDYYDAYNSLVNLVVNPSGSLQTFSSNFNDADSSVANAYSRMKLYLD